jgi:predicted transposase YbfD/YdcC
MATTSLEIKKHFRSLQDPRRRHGRRHLLLDLVVIAVCAVTGGADNWEEIAAFGRRHEAWFRRYLSLPNGLPSHDTLTRVFARLDPQVFQRCLRDWLLALGDVLQCDHIAIDGKTLRGSGRKASGLGPLHLVSAWASAHHLILGQVAVEGKSNEITAIPQLLALLETKGAVITIDAMGCQKEIAATIRERRCHYVLAVKDNQPNLHQDIQEAFVRAHENDFAGIAHDCYETKTTNGHGRQEKRYCEVIYDLAGIRNQEAWADLRAIGMCITERTLNGATTGEVRYFIGSQKQSARYYGSTFRKHWGIENNLHWQMDVSFGEDANRTAERTAAENLTLIRRAAQTLVKRDPQKGGIKCKRRQAGWDLKFLEKLLRGAVDLEKE